MRWSIVIALGYFWLTPIFAGPPPEPHNALKPAFGPDTGQSYIALADSLYYEHDYKAALHNYEYALALETTPSIKAPILKKMALSHAALDHVDECVDYIEESLRADFDPTVLTDDGFDIIRDTPLFDQLDDKYTPSFNIWSSIYLYVALIGFYISVMINFNKKIDSVARLLISLFIFIHSLFIFHICLSITKYEYVYPHSYLMSTSFSFLYGPLLYFYFKRTTQHYSFRPSDLFHLVPTLLLLIYLVPIYSLSGDEKLELLFQDAEDGFTLADFTLVSLKLTSLLAYGYFIRKLYLESKRKKELQRHTETWQRNLYRIHFLYIGTYLLYCIFISNGLYLFHFQIMCMALMVLYVGYFASVQPDVFSGFYRNTGKLLFKYEKSGLTKDLSLELMQNLRRLFDIEKIYKENDICLDKLAQRLDTTRHNASQVINEHFNMSFHELVNKYRIQEAKSMLKTDIRKNLNIIDIAYEVGYNNKVTFNKAFKKDTNLTPSQYQKTAVKPQEIPV
ncbi:helix-turn-helix domain-containing protein [Pseudozobellia thermophila]|uniref:Transcriptional regulator, AraC family n=1 Tax=Pseudozobellia thermophila TaxID=192903 RepID=A0A1M6HPV1_9FLAO|nr:helix-turn-helix domain-containing protein [Pseudozobellia thermophila]SHJ24133.1 transcriptional regulator, AraC family [Pseudozobellia thermophila]